MSILFIISVAPAHAWWNGEWTLRRKITIDTTQTGSALTEATGSVPVLVRLHEGDFSFASARADGTDLRFVAEDDKTLLPFHLERIDPVLDEAYVWVKLPEVKPGSKQTIWLYYGNNGNKAGKVEDPKGTYDADTALVYHFSEKGQPPYDFSGSGNAAQTTPTSVEGSLIAGGARLDGHTALVIAGENMPWIERGTWTASLWVKPASLQSNATILSRRDAGHSLVVGLDNGVPYIEVSNAGNTARSAATTTLPAGSWKHLSVVANGARITLFVDGDVYETVNVGLPGLNAPIYLGGDSAGAAGFVGEIDELTFARSARSASYLKFLALSQGADAEGHLLTVGPDEQESSWLSALKTGYFGVIVSSLTVDGWVVIGILMIMSGISWVIMVKKAGYLSRITKGNDLFLKQWSQVATDLSVLDSDDAEDARSLGGRISGSHMKVMRNSPLYHIYHIGVEEIRHRLSADRSGGSAGKILKGRSILAIRAALDGGLVRETQKLNNAMVLLTIAISGGPFLGLLGTVVGVMITFAAVAQAGDVNVNAIAPGIAAALLATVAGLAVAIPALFGYNYLLTRVKSATSNMHVFIDEFVTKLAEFYGKSLGE